MKSDHCDRIVIVNASREGPDDALGGIQKAIIGQISALRTRGIEIELLSAARRCSEIAHGLGCVVHHDPRWHNNIKPLFVPDLSRILLSIRRKRPAAVIHHSGRTWTWGHLFFAGTPNIAVMHRERTHTYRFFRRWLTLSPGYMAEVRRRDPLRAWRRVAWAPNCLMKSPAATPRPANGLRDKSGITLGFLGRASSGKGLEILFQAMHRVRADGMDVRLKLAGTLDPWILTTAGELGLQNAVESLGWLEDPADLFAAIDCLVLPSEKESFGLVLIEAMAAGLPVIATRCNGPASIVVDHQTGLLVTIGDVDQLTRAIKTMTENPALAIQMGQHGFKRVLERYTPGSAASPLIASLSRLGACLSGINTTKP